MSALLMPRLSDSMEAGTILTWLKADGDEVAVGDELLEIETDKAVMTYVAEAAGTLRIAVPAGEAQAVGAAIGSIGDAAAAPVAAAPEPREPVAAVAPTAASGNGRGDGPRASPLARRIAAVHDVDLGALTGTGPGGRITRQDVAAVAGLEAAPVPLPREPAAPSAVDAAKGITTRHQPSRLQDLIARRMAEAQAAVPDFQVATDVEMSAAIAFRQQLRGAVGDAPVPSYNDMVIKAAAMAVRAFPRANGAYADGGFLAHERVNVGMAVAAEDSLVVPTIFDADRVSLGTIACETRRLAEAVRTGTITPPDLAGGTFTVSNLGMFGMTAISPIINGGQAAILGVGAFRDVLARRDGELVDLTLMTLTLTCDHRILYGADAARLLSRIRELLEAPLLLVL